MTRIHCLFAVLLIAGLTSAATAGLFEDSFSDDDATGVWRLSNNGVKVRERSNKMRFRSEFADDNDYRAATASALGWSFDCTRSFDLEFDYKMKAEAYSPDWATVGARIELDDGRTGMHVLIVQDVNGRWVVFESWAENVLLDAQAIPIDDKRGAIELDYGRGSDELKVKLNGSRIMYIEDFMGGLGIQSGEDANLVLFAERFGIVEWDEGDVWIDSLSLDGDIDFED